MSSTILELESRFTAAFFLCITSMPSIYGENNRIINQKVYCFLFTKYKRGEKKSPPYLIVTKCKWREIVFYSVNSASQYMQRYTFFFLSTSLNLCGISCSMEVIHLGFLHLITSESLSGKSRCTFFSSSPFFTILTVMLLSMYPRMSKSRLMLPSTFMMSFLPYFSLSAF